MIVQSVVSNFTFDNNKSQIHFTLWFSAIFSGTSKMVSVIMWDSSLRWPDRCHFRLRFGKLPRWPMDWTDLPHRILLFGCYVIDYKWMVLPLAREPGWPPMVRDLLGQYDAIYQLNTMYIYIFLPCYVCIFYGHDPHGPISMCLWYKEIKLFVHRWA